MVSFSRLIGAFFRIGFALLRRPFQMIALSVSPRQRQKSRCAEQASVLGIAIESLSRG